MIIRILSATLITLGINFWLTKPVQIAIAQDITTEQTTESARERHVIKVTVSAPDDIKVQEGDRIEVGQVIAERGEEKRRLEVKRDELSLAITQLQEPLIIPSQPPAPSYAPEQAALESARLSVEYWDSVVKPDFRFVKEEMIMVHDKAVLDERQDIALNQLKAQTQLNTAIANLQTAKNQYEYSVYQYQVSLLEIEQSQRERKLEVLNLGSRLDEIDRQLTAFAAVKSPYSGRVRKVQIINQSDLQINAEITLLITKSDSPLDAQTTDKVIQENP